MSPAAHGDQGVPVFQGKKSVVQNKTPSMWGEVRRQVSPSANLLQRLSMFNRNFPTGGFHKWVYGKVIIHLRLGCSIMNHPLVGPPHGYGNPHFLVLGLEKPTSTICESKEPRSIDPASPVAGTGFLSIRCWVLGLDYKRYGDVN